ncbi:DNA-binding protein [Clostridium sp. AF37-5AT]|nr:DNA-binding protein [Clostridium sp. AF37-5AT]RHO93320.1 DNA-binding protein [Clostridium sp. AF37-5AT]
MSSKRNQCSGRPEFAKWNLSVRRVQTICNEGMIEGAMKFGNTWAIPKNAVKPVDKRIKSGKYIKS